MRTKPQLHVYTPTYKHAEAAINAGVKHISVNGPALGLRSEQANLTWEQIEELRQNYPDSHIYLRLNTVMHNNDLALVAEMLTKAKSIGIAGIVYTDTAILQLTKKLGISFKMLLETETTVTNIEMIRFWNQQGVSNFLLSRELSIEQIMEMINRKQALDIAEDIQISIQIHGPVGIFHTLRSVLSNYDRYVAEIGEGLALDEKEPHNKSSMNSDFTLVEEMRPEESYRVIEDTRGTYIFSAYDISLYEYLPDLLTADIEFLKIDIFNSQTVESMVGIIKFYVKAINEYDDGNFSVRADWQEYLQSINQYPIQNQFIKTGAPQ
ncbi:peptidase U32 family protein [Desulfuribacillus alkaliarsenatis]|uniref:Peptidase U32 n=1 Tax=Desulfuribacillus alkaliarsenatis TaxID=766136 RepID=A0A1E5G4Y3_9FIRM|nr:U32 family peptidase [Desulfuribacillus alkaliarsenatis]OEF98223.1 hypothetical protein BHF68_00610 [Desulfuribacillus alkaliarsenatis]